MAFFSLFFATFEELNGFVSFVVKQHLKAKMVLSVCSSTTLDGLDISGWFCLFVLLPHLKSWMV